MAARSKMDDFDVVSRLGSGSFGTVYKGNCSGVLIEFLSGNSM